jgi:hypothetical protein
MTKPRPNFIVRLLAGLLRPVVAETLHPYGGTDTAPRGVLKILIDSETRASVTAAPAPCPHSGK